MKLSHLDEHGRARMVDVGGKPTSERTAVAEGAALHQASLRDRWEDYWPSTRGVLTWGALISAIDYVRDSMELEVQYVERSAALEPRLIVYPNGSGGRGPLARAAQRIRDLQRS